MNRIGWLATAVLASIALVAPARSQERLAERETVSGEVKGIRGNVLAVVGADGKEWLVKLPDNGERVTFVGTADPAFLTRGMLVRFRNTFDKKGKPLNTVRELTIFTPPAAFSRRTMRTGELPDGMEATDFLPGVHVDQGIVAGDFFSSDAPKEAPETVAAKVVGLVNSFRGTKLKVAAGSYVLDFDLEDPAILNVEFHDLRFVREGDSVQATGLAYPAMPGQLFSNEVVVTAKEPLGLKPEKETPGKEKPADPDSPDQPKPEPLDLELK